MLEVKKEMTKNGFKITSFKPVIFKVHDNIHFVKLLDPEPAPWGSGKEVPAEMKNNVCGCKGERTAVVCPKCWKAHIFPKDAYDIYDEKSMYAAEDGSILRPRLSQNYSDREAEAMLRCSSCGKTSYYPGTRIYSRPDAKVALLDEKTIGVGAFIGTRENGDKRIGLQIIRNQYFLNKKGMKVFKRSVHHSLSFDPVRLMTFVTTDGCHPYNWSNGDKYIFDKVFYFNFGFSLDEKDSTPKAASYIRDVLSLIEKEAGRDGMFKKVTFPEEFNALFGYDFWSDVVMRFRYPAFADDDLFSAYHAQLFNKCKGLKPEKLLETSKFRLSKKLKKTLISNPSSILLFNSLYNIGFRDINNVFDIYQTLTEKIFHQKRLNEMLLQLDGDTIFSDEFISSPFNGHLKGVSKDQFRKNHSTHMRDYRFVIDAITKKYSRRFFRELLKNKTETDAKKFITDAPGFLDDSIYIYGKIIKTGKQIGADDEALIKTANGLFKLKNIKSLHDEMTLLEQKIGKINKRLDYEGEKARSLLYEDDGITIRFPRDTYEMIDIGAKMHICVGSYTEDVAERRKVVMCMEENGQYIGCLELSKDFKSVRQIKGEYNRALKGTPASFVRKWIEKNELIPDSYDYNMMEPFI